MLPYISDDKVRRLLDEPTAFRLAREAFLRIAKHRTQMPEKVYLDITGRRPGDFRAMPAYCQTRRGRGAAGIKWISVFPENRREGLPTVMGTVILNCVETGRPLAIMEASLLTAVRTAAAAAVAAHHLANPRPRKLAIVGAGLQAEHQLKALASRYPFREIAVWGLVEGEAEGFCVRLAKEFPALRPEPRLKTCVEGADIVSTCTPSRRPLVKKEWVKKGAHINAIGADAKGKEELDPRLLVSSKVVVDEWHQASHSGEINVPFSRGLFLRRHLYAELPEIVSGKKKGRTSLREITIFDSTGLAVLDIYFADAVLHACPKAV